MAELEGTTILLEMDDYCLYSAVSLGWQREVSIFGEGSGKGIEIAAADFQRLMAEGRSAVSKLRITLHGGRLGQETASKLLAVEGIVAWEPGSEEHGRMLMSARKYRTERFLPEWGFLPAERQLVVRLEPLPTSHGGRSGDEQS